MTYPKRTWKVWIGIYEDAEGKMEVCGTRIGTYAPPLHVADYWSGDATDWI